MKYARSWWVPAVILALAFGAAIGASLLLPEVDVAIRFQLVASIGLVAQILLALWWLFLNPLGWRWRLTGAGIVVALVGIVAALVRIDRLDGDVFPTLAWRWSASADREPDEAATAVLNRAGTARVDCPGFLGAAHDGMVRGVDLAGDWQANPPTICWRRQVGAAWSGFAVAGDAAVTMEQYGDEEVVACYHLADGSVRWRHRYVARYESSLGGTGPRSTPSLAGGSVYALGATGELRCLDLADGSLRWRKRLLEDEGGVSPKWGMAGSPLVADGLVVVPVGNPAGRAVVAWDRATGEERWAAGEDPLGFASPVLAQVDGREVVVLFHWRSVVLYDLATGTVVARIPWMMEGPTAAQPLVVPPDRLVVSAGYGSGTAGFVIEVGGDPPFSELWRSRALMAKFSNVVHRDGSLYGLSDGTLVCLDAATGQGRWRGERYGHGQLFLVGKHLLVSGEKEGLVALVAADPAACRVLGTVDVFDDEPMTNPPCFAPPYLLLRTTREAACVEVPLD